MLVMLLVASAATPKADFDRCVSVLQKRPSYAASATATTTARGVTVVTSATIAVRSKNWVTIDVSTPAELGHGALDWICEVHNRALRAYDSKRHAYIEQTFNDPLPAAQGLVAQFGAMIPDPIQRLMSPQNLQGFFDRFLVLKGWQQSSPGESIVWRCKNKVGSVEFDFDRSSGRLTKWQIHGTSMTTWKLKYPSLSSISPLRIPADSVLVETLRLPAPRPKITDPRASKTVASCFDAYDKAFRFSCTVRVDGVPTRIWRDGGMVEQVGPTGGWRWSRGILTVWPKGHGVISGRTRLSKVRSYLGELNVD
ncbi:MAG TPA: hypothetical protein VKT78_01730, partial [Fimbriimonadaceae bacterium]|nr:hypothetical protein [Fimbriimonadaceae bacterium]